MQFHGLITPDMMKKSQVNISDRETSGVKQALEWMVCASLIGWMDNGLGGLGRMCAVASNMPN